MLRFLYSAEPAKLGVQASKAYTGLTKSELWFDGAQGWELLLTCLVQALVCAVWVRAVIFTGAT